MSAQIKKKCRQRLMRVRKGVKNGEVVGGVTAGDEKQFSAPKEVSK